MKEMNVNNPLLDSNFLHELTEYPHRDIYAKIIALNIKEEPIEEISGKISSGSLNIDGNSSLRRTCSLNMIAQGVSINEFYWGIKSKFELYIGLANYIDNKYPEIVWFPEGIFVITNFATTEKVNGCSIAISGKDKMCLLNGDMGGSINAITDFGKLEEYDSKTNTTIFTPIKIKNIIKEMIHAYGNEPWHNIFINDLEDQGVELLDYLDKTPMYLYINQETAMVNQATLDDTAIVYAVQKNSDETWTYGASKSLKDLSENELDARISNNNLFEVQDLHYFAVLPEAENSNNEFYSIAKIEQHTTAGYRLTDLIYPEDLIANVGESITSVLDKIIKMLGPFEYFYDEFGRFIFQRKPTFIGAPWSNLVRELEDDRHFINNASETEEVMYSFDNQNLVISFSNKPNINNLKNDFTIWGEKTSALGTKIPIHLRYAIDKKPQKYFALGDGEKRPSKFYYSMEYQPKEGELITERWDWRELLYQMALDYRKYNHDDDFLFRVATNNKEEYPTGETGYEQYYTDMEGFWRTLYIPADEKQKKIEEAKLKKENSLNLLREEQGCPIVDSDGWIETNQKNNLTQYGAINEEFKKQNLAVEKTFQQSIMDLLKTHLLINKADIEPFFPENPLSAGLYYSRYLRFNTIFMALIREEEKLKQEPNAEKLMINKLNKIKLIYLYNNDYNINSIITTNKNISLTDQINAVQEKEILELKDIIFPLIVNNELLQINKISELTNIDNIQYLDEILSIDMKILEDRKKVVKDRDTATRTASQEFKRKRNNLFIYCETEKEKIELEFKHAVENYENFGLTNTVSQGAGLWNNSIFTDPESLLFWIDFLDTQGEISKYSIQNVGDRPKPVKDNNVKGIYFKETPNVLFIQDENERDEIRYPGYTYIKLDPGKESLFSISGQGKSTKNVLDDLMYKHLQCADSITLTTVPIYFLQPNHRIMVYDTNSKIYGKYIISKLTIPLTFNGTMNIQAFKAPDRFL